MQIATAQEAINGNSNDTIITPLRLKQVLSSKKISGGAGNDSYSTTEQKVGTWIDGKDIYRKVFTGGAINNSTETTVGTLTDFDKVINIHGMAHFIMDNQQYYATPLPNVLYDNISWNTGIKFYGTTGEIKLSRGAWGSINYYHIIVEYTKN